MVYFDHNATTPPDERVVEAMLPFLGAHYANPSSRHREGRYAHQAMEKAREQVAALVAAHPSQVIFTSGGSEANNAVIKGLALTHQPGHLLYSGIEHASVQAPCQSLQRMGWQVEALRVDESGVFQVDDLAGCLRTDTRLVSLMHANNETGAIQDVAAVAGLARERGILVHSDAVQSAGKIAVDFAALDAHFLSLSAHKLHGPKGVGALIVDKSVELPALIDGGGQENGHRGGTENLAGIVGFGMAAQIAGEQLQPRQEHMLYLRRRLEEGMHNRLPGVVIFAEAAPRLPNTVFASVPNIEGQTLIMALDSKGYAVSSGSACGSSVQEPSKVLKAMGVDPQLAAGAVRISLGATNTEQEVDGLLDTLVKQVSEFNKMAAVSW